MALAYLRPNELVSGQFEYTADTGTNSYYLFRIGSKAIDADELERVVFTSPVQQRGSMANPFNSEFTLRIPSRLFSRGARHVQMISFRDLQRNGPALSNIVMASPVWNQPDIEGSRRGLNEAQSSMKVQFANDQSIACRQTPFSFQESRFSQQMFLNELLSVLRALTPAVLEALPRLVGSGNSGAGLTGQANDVAPNRDAILALLRMVVNAARDSASLPSVAAPPAPPALPAPPAAAVAPAETAAGASISSPGRFVLPNHLRAGDRRFPQVSRQQILDGGVLTGPLLGALLGPMLQQAPQLLQILTDRPIQFLTALVQNQLQRRQNDQEFMMRLLTEANRNFTLQQLMQHMRANGQQLPQEIALASGAGSSAFQRTAAVSFGGQIANLPRFSDKISLLFDPGRTLEIFGKAKSVFTPAQGIVLTARLSVVGTAPAQPLPRAILEVKFVELDNQTPVLSKEWRLENVAADAALRLSFTPDELRTVPRHRDLQVSATLRWPAPHGHGLLGARGDHAIYLTDGFLVLAVGSTVGKEIPLRDIGRYRAFWNKIWETAGTQSSRASRWELDALCRYYIRANFDQDTNARIETRMFMEPPDPAAITEQTKGRMKSGMELSLNELNRLVPVLCGQAPLTFEELAALKSSELRNRFDLEATSRLRATGKRATAGTVWVFPEFTTREITLAEAGELTDDGAIVSLRQRIVRFPFPSSVHFVTLRSI